jgi:hypothetical protein
MFNARLVSGSASAKRRLFEQQGKPSHSADYVDMVRSERGFVALQWVAQQGLSAVVPLEFFQGVGHARFDGRRVPNPIVVVFQFAPCR